MRSIAMAHPDQTLLLSIGNPLRGDDGAGWAVADWLRGRAEIPPRTRIVQGRSAGPELLILLQDCARAILVDAAQMGLPPGSWKRVEADDLIDGRLPQASTHLGNLAQTLILGRQLGLLPPELHIFGIQPEQTGWGSPLSQQVSAGVRQVARAILSLLQTDPVSQTAASGQPHGEADPCSREGHTGIPANARRSRRSR